MKYIKWIVRMPFLLLGGLAWSTLMSVVGIIFLFAMAASWAFDEDMGHWKSSLDPVKKMMVDWLRAWRP